MCKFDEFAVSQLSCAHKLLDKHLRDDKLDSIKRSYAIMKWQISNEGMVGVGPVGLHGFVRHHRTFKRGFRHFSRHIELS